MAAGSGRRFGRPKHTLEIDGTPLFMLARNALMDGGCVDVVVVGDVPGGIPGGERRRDSVEAGLAALPPGVDRVLVHDAARPLATSTLAAAVAARLDEGDVGGVVPGVPVRDTVKQVDSSGLVVATVPRHELVAVQTPQGFIVAELVAAAKADNSDVTDEAALLERAGVPVAVVPGEPGNIKITYPRDLMLARALRASAPR